MCDEMKMGVKSVWGDTENFTVKMDDLTKGARYEGTWVYDIGRFVVLVDDNTNILEGKPERWKEIIGKNELKIISIFGRKRNLSTV